MNLIGRKVYGCAGVGDFPKEGLASDEGVIVGEEDTMFGEFWVVRWNNGHEEPFMKCTVKPVEEFNGIGVYYE